MSAFHCAHTCFTLHKCAHYVEREGLNQAASFTLYCICIIDKHFGHRCSFCQGSIINSWDLISPPCMEWRDVASSVTSEQWFHQPHVHKGAPTQMLSYTWSIKDVPTPVHLNVCATTSTWYWTMCRFPIAYDYKGTGPSSSSSIPVYQISHTAHW